MLSFELRLLSVTLTFVKIDDFCTSSGQADGGHNIIPPVFDGRIKTTYLSQVIHHHQ